MKIKLAAICIGLLMLVGCQTVEEKQEQKGNSVVKVAEDLVKSKWVIQGVEGKIALTTVARSGDLTRVTIYGGTQEGELEEELDLEAAGISYEEYIENGGDLGHTVNVVVPFVTVIEFSKGTEVKRERTY